MANYETNLTLRPAAHIEYPPEANYWNPTEDNPFEIFDGSTQYVWVDGRWEKSEIPRLGSVPLVKPYVVHDYMPVVKTPAGYGYMVHVTPSPNSVVYVHFPYDAGYEFTPVAFISFEVDFDVPKGLKPSSETATVNELHKEANVKLKHVSKYVQEKPIGHTFDYKRFYDNEEGILPIMEDPLSMCYPNMPSFNTGLNSLLPPQPVPLNQKPDPGLQAFLNTLGDSLMSKGFNQGSICDNNNGDNDSGCTDE